jgi:hypothetical protein
MPEMPRPADQVERRLLEVAQIAASIRELQPEFSPAARFLRQGSRSRGKVSKPIV